MRFKLPVTFILEPQTAVIWLRVGVEIFQVVSCGKNQVFVPILIEISVDQACPSQIEIDGKPESPSLELTFSEISKPPQFFLTPSHNCCDIQLPLPIILGDGHMNSAGSI